MGKKRLRPLAKVNVFVGANNCGKSRLMRAIAATPKLKVLPNFSLFAESISWDEVHSVLQNVKDQVLAALKATRSQDVNGVRKLVDGFPLRRFTTEGGNQIGESIHAIDKMSTMSPPSSYESRSDPIAATDRIKRIGQDNKPKLAHICQEACAIPETKKLYIPTLRSLRDLGVGDGYGDRTKHDYFQKAAHVEIFTGRTLYDDIEQLVRGDLAQRDTLRRFETWIGETFFQGEHVAIIPRIKQTTLTIKIGNDKEQPIHDLGDGIQAVLILAFPLFVRENEHLLTFIEEPELFLHPWIQRVLLEMLSTRFPHQQYFLTTHSNHFLDLTLDMESVSVFAFEKHEEEKGDRERLPRYQVTNASRSDRKPLELLGVRNSSVLLTNCTIWVEGITDRRYLAHWLDLYQQHLHGTTPSDRAKFFKEDLHYSFVEYSGGNITHWSFLDEEGPDVNRLCGKLFLIADNDGAKLESGKGKRHAKLAEKLQERFCLLPVREIENLLTPETLRNVLEAYGESPENLGTPKPENYATKPLGKFIEEKVLQDPANKKRKASYAGDSGTVSDKANFCEKAIASMQIFERLSADAKALTERVFNFIKSANHT